MDTIATTQQAGQGCRADAVRERVEYWLALTDPERSIYDALTDAAILAYRSAGVHSRRARPSGYVLDMAAGDELMERYHAHRTLMEEYATDAALARAGEAA